MSAPPERPPRITTVLLDAGGVLLDLDYPYLRRLLQARGHGVSDEQLARAEAVARSHVDRRVREGQRVSDAWRDYFRVLLSHVGAPVALLEPAIDVLWEAHQRHGLWTVAIPGSVEAVREIKRRGFKVGVVSNAEGRVEQDLGAAGYAGLLDTVVDSHHVGVEKPDPAIFRIALERVGGAAEESVFLGDVPAVDVAGARAAGIAPLLLDRFGVYPEAGVPTLRSPGELLEWLAG